jgi:hypothetical protein
MNDLDTGRPNLARVHDYSLGGKDNYGADRAAWEQITEVAPQLGHLHRSSRFWLARVVRYVAQCTGVDQFLDLGAGLPDAMNTHDFAQEWGRHDVHVVYVDSGRPIRQLAAAEHLMVGGLAYKARAGMPPCAV